MKIEIDRVREIVKYLIATDQLNETAKCCTCGWDTQKFLKLLDELEAEENIKVTHNSICPYCLGDWKEEFDRKAYSYSIAFPQYNEGKIECPNCKEVFEYKFKDQPKPKMWLHTYLRKEHTRPQTELKKIEQYITDQEKAPYILLCEHIKTEVWNG